MAAIIRPPAVAGRFYPSNPDRLLQEVRGYTDATGEKLRAIGCVVPHAGYMYSGHVAGAVYARLELPKTFIILCPNHTGMGQPLAIMSEGAWMTPLGKVRVDGELANALKASFPQLTEDVVAHRIKKRPRDIRPDCNCSSSSSVVIRKPLSAKKTSTPKKPPGSHGHSK